MTLDQLIPQHVLAAHRARACAWVLWLLRVVLALGAPARSRRLKRYVKALERYIERIVFLTAVRSFGHLPQRKQRTQSASPRGFRRVRSTGRLLLRSARICAKGALRQRIERLCEVCADPRRFVLRFLKRLMRGLCTRRLLAVAPPSIALAGADAARPALADSS
jgi:hypothetical protein